jgi:hypothetical protein
MGFADDLRSDWIRSKAHYSPTPNKKTPHGAGYLLVAGVGFEPTTFRL